MKNVTTDVSLEQQIDSLPKELAPERDLWSGIEKAIAAQPQDRDRKTIGVYPVAWAATIVVTVLVSWLSFTPAPNQSNLNLAQVMAHDFDEQKQLMLVSLGKPDLKQLTPDMQMQLDELQKAQQAISKALVNDPNNAELLNLLRWTQKQELDLLKQIYSPQWQTI